jgi:uncharacterized membrane protein
MKMIPSMTQKQMTTNNSRHGERGQVLVWTIVMLPLLLALVGLVFDGGLLWVQYRRARWAADGAAVAAASLIDAEQFARTGQVELMDDANLAARWYARQNDPNLNVTSTYITDNVIYTNGTTTVEPVFLSIFGVDALRLRVRGRERPAWGIEQAGQ